MIAGATVPVTTAAAVSSPAIQAAEKWAAMDPNPTTRQFTLDLVSKALGSSDNDPSAEALSSLEDLFPSDPLKRIGFGTAGLRSEMKSGPLGMNDLTVCQAAQGIAKYCLKQQQEPRSGSPRKRLRAVVGYDHRSHPTLNISSLSFAILTAIVFAEAGIDCILLCANGGGNPFVHTPLVPFSIQRLGAVCGIMITASHNPSRDNGYKVYDLTNNGGNNDESYACQIRSPTDRIIAAEILDNLEPWKDYGRIIEERRREHPGDPCLGLSDARVTKRMLEEYCADVLDRNLSVHDSNATVERHRQPSFVYTAMHGVGWPFAKRAFEIADLSPFDAVPEQKDPDPSFPTVPFPNPEEEGALDLAKAYADEKGADIVLANDPDADRLAVAERDRTKGTWTTFTGDQIGTMIGLSLWETIGKLSKKPVSMCTSTVSSKMLAEIGKKEGFLVEETLSGFKWIGSRGAALKAEGYHHIFGYEEAIGFACGDAIFDKDGISAMVVLARLAVQLYDRETTLKEHMDHLYAKYGFFCSRNGYFLLPDNGGDVASVVGTIFDRLQRGGYEAVREALEASSSETKRLALVSIRDLGYPGYDSTKPPPEHKPALPVSRSAPLLTLRVSIATTGGASGNDDDEDAVSSNSSSSNCVVQLRPSGTEPKFKYYLEIQGSPGTSEDTIRDELRFVEEVVLDRLLYSKEYGLTKKR